MILVDNSKGTGYYWYWGDIMSGDKELITARVLAKALDLSVETIWRYTREKKIPYTELGRKRYRYKLADVISVLERLGVRENSAGYKTEPGKKLTYQDYLLMPEESGYRYEILDGVLVKDPSPNVMHQRIIRRLLRILENFFCEIDSDGEIFIAPLDVTFQDISVVQPDLFYVSGEQKRIVKDARIDGPPALVVEVISPSSNRKDRMQKMRIYQTAGVQHYWLVNPDEKTLECFALRDGLYFLAASGMDEDVVDHQNFPGFSIDLKALW